MRIGEGGSSALGASGESSGSSGGVAGSEGGEAEGDDAACLPRDPDAGGGSSLSKVRTAAARADGWGCVMGCRNAACACLPAAAGRVLCPAHACPYATTQVVMARRTSMAVTGPVSGLWLLEALQVGAHAWHGHTAT